MIDLEKISKSIKDCRGKTIIHVVVDDVSKLNCEDRPG